jgi:hypothetical protein
VETDLRVAGTGPERPNLLGDPGIRIPVERDPQESRRVLRGRSTR